MNNKSDRIYVFIDTETGGTDPNKHSLLSVGLCIWDIDKNIIDNKEIFIKNDNYTITKKAQKINKFNLIEHNNKAIGPNEAIKEMLDFCYKYIDVNTAIPIVGHNIQFDVNFLKKLFKDNNRSFNQYFSHRYIDTYSVFKTCVLAGLINENLNSSAEAFSYFGIRVNRRHSALGDCIATVELYENLLNLLSKQG